MLATGATAAAATKGTAGAAAEQEGSSAMRGYLKMWRHNLVALIVILALLGIFVGLVVWLHTHPPNGRTPQLPQIEQPS